MTVLLSVFRIIVSSIMKSQPIRPFRHLQTLTGNLYKAPVKVIPCHQNMRKNCLVTTNVPETSSLSLDSTKTSPKKTPTKGTPSNLVISPMMQNMIIGFHETASSTQKIEILLRFCECAMSDSSITHKYFIDLLQHLFSGYHARTFPLARPKPRPPREFLFPVMKSVHKVSLMSSRDFLWPPDSISVLQNTPRLQTILQRILTLASTIYTELQRRNTFLRFYNQATRQKWCDALFYGIFLPAELAGLVLPATTSVMWARMLQFSCLKHFMYCLQHDPVIARRLILHACPTILGAFQRHFEGSFQTMETQARSRLRRILSLCSDYMHEQRMEDNALYHITRCIMELRDAEFAMLLVECLPARFQFQPPRLYRWQNLADHFEASDNLQWKLRKTTFCLVAGVWQNPGFAWDDKVSLVFTLAQDFPEILCRDQPQRTSLIVWWWLLAHMFHHPQDFGCETKPQTLSLFQASFPHIMQRLLDSRRTILRSLRNLIRERDCTSFPRTHEFLEAIDAFYAQALDRLAHQAVQKILPSSLPSTSAQPASQSTGINATCCHPIVLPTASGPSTPTPIPLIRKPAGPAFPFSSTKDLCKGNSTPSPDTISSLPWHGPNEEPLASNPFFTPHYDSLDDSRPWEPWATSASAFTEEGFPLPLVSSPDSVEPDLESLWHDTLKHQLASGGDEQLI